MNVIKKPIFWMMSALSIVFLLGILHRLEALDDLNNQQAQVIAPVKVYAERVMLGNISSWVVGEGTALAVHKRHLFFKSEGKVVFMGHGADGRPIREGSVVYGPVQGETFGQTLARLDQRNMASSVLQSEAELSEAKQSVIAAEANIDHARTELNIAQSNYKRHQILRKDSIVSISQLEQSKADFESAQSGLKNANAELKASKSRVKSMQAGLNQAKISMEDTAIFAPFDGVIARLNIAEGDFFNPGSLDYTNPATVLDTACITIVDPKELEVALNLPVYDGRLVKEGQHAVVTWGGLDRLFGRSKAMSSDQTTMINGMVYSVSPVLNPEGRTVRIKVRLKQKGMVIPHGMFVRCWIETEQKDNALLVPIESLLYRDGIPLVYAISNGVATRRTVQIGITENNKVEVTHGLTSGEEVVTKGKYRLHESTTVNVIVPKEA